jgi:hypothetical protein
MAAKASAKLLAAPLGFIIFAYLFAAGSRLSLPLNSGIIDTSSTLTFTIIGAQNAL